MSPAAHLSIRIYRFIARTLPEDFLRLYGPEMIEASEDAIRDVAARRGLTGLLPLMFHLVMDLVRRLPSEHASEVWSDVRQGLRQMRQMPWVTLTSVLSLGFGMGLCTSVYNQFAVMFQPVPGVGRAAELTQLEAPVSLPAYEVIAREGPFTEVAAFRPTVPFILQRGVERQRVWGQIVTPNYFQVLGTTAQAGRTFGPETRSGADGAVAVMSERMWKGTFGGSPDLVGRVITVNGQPVEVIGIAEAGFLGASPLGSAVDLWFPLTTPAGLAPEFAPGVLHSTTRRDFRATGRLKPGVSRTEGAAAVDVLVRRAADTPPADDAWNRGRRAGLLPGGQLLPVRDEDLPLILAVPAVLVILSMWIACANVATMLIARGVTRRRELSIRVAVGASRRRVIKQLLTESVLLSVLGGLAGVVSAIWGNYETNRWMSIIPPTVGIRFTMDWTAFIFAFGVSVVSGILFGLAPAFQATRIDPASGLKAGMQWFVPGYRWMSSRNLLVLQQVAASLMLMVVTGVVVVGFQRAASVLDVGFRADGVLTLSIDPLRDGLDREEFARVLHDLPGQLETLPGVSAASVSESVPLARAIRLRSAARGGSAPSTLPTQHEYVGDGHFEALGARVLQGRGIERDDIRLNRGVVVVNEDLAREAWPSSTAVGQILETDGGKFEVVGVVRNFRSANLLATRELLAFHPLTLAVLGERIPENLTIVVRSENADIRQAVRGEIERRHPNLTIFDVRMMQDRIGDIVSLIQITVLLYGSIGLFGLLLAAVGLAGVTAYAVARRTKEIGIRVSLGATRAQILRLVSREAAALVAVGTVAGMAAAWGLLRLINRWVQALQQVTDTSATDPLLLAGGPLLLLLLTALACYLPARRSLRINPLAALRAE